MKNKGALAFALGFFITAIPLTLWLLWLEPEEVGFKVFFAVAIQFAVGLAAKHFFLKQDRTSVNVK